ncbi:MAG: hypothetical protein J0L75_07325 [Spirochaetes bacterium]|nr:hypothetical protein [Spirochaetota bacterium]
MHFLSAWRYMNAQTNTLIGHGQKNLFKMLKFEFSKITIILTVLLVSVFLQSCLMHDDIDGFYFPEKNSASVLVGAIDEWFIRDMNYSKKIDGQHFEFAYDIYSNGILVKTDRQTGIVDLRSGTMFFGSPVRFLNKFHSNWGYSKSFDIIEIVIENNKYEYIKQNLR